MRLLPAFILSLPLAVAGIIFAADPLQVEVGDTKELTVTLPALTREDMEALIWTFLLRQPDRVREYSQVVQGAKELTLVLTTKRRKP